MTDPGYTPYTTRAMVEAAHAVGMKVIPWTIDDPFDITDLLTAAEPTDASPRSVPSDS